VIQVDCCFGRRRNKEGIKATHCTKLHSSSSSFVSVIDYRHDSKEFDTSRHTDQSDVTIKQSEVSFRIASLKKKEETGVSNAS
jgi:hypothetical protein